MPPKPFDSGKNNPIKASAVLTAISAASSGFLILWIALGPHSGMERLGIIIPWMIALAVHIFLSIPALLWAWQGRPHTGFWWIYGYFLLFWGMNAYIVVDVDQLRVDVNQRLDRLLKPAETELAARLEQAREAAYRQTDVDPNNLHRIRELIREGVDLSYRKPGSRRSMIADAAALGSADLIHLLAEKNADLNGGKNPGPSPLIEAVGMGHAETAAALIQHGVNPDDAGSHSRSPLEEAVGNKDRTTARVLLDAGASTEPSKPDRQPALHIAAWNGDAAMMELLLDAGADPNRRAHDQSTAMLVATARGCLACMQRLLAAGGNLTGRLSHGDGVLVRAIKGADPEIISLLRNTLHNSRDPVALLGADAYADMLDAIRRSELGMLRQLLDLGVPADMAVDTRPPLMLAISGRTYSRVYVAPEIEVQAAEILIEYHADIDATDRQGNTALILAARSGASKLGMWLLAKGADFRMTNRDGVSPLHAALRGGYHRLANALIQAGADPEAATHAGIRKERNAEDVGRKER